jgi:glyoxylase-like metal-dependent hydrolase (beta-lactamase superfamily II)
MSNTFRVGDMTVHRIVEMECGFTPALEFLPDLKAELLEENKSWLAPSALDADGNLVLCFQSYIVKTPRHTILVDSCIGNDKERTARPLWHRKKDDTFMRGLAAAGLTVNDIDFVMCTHLHVDHVGWNTRLENGRWVPTFPKARYLFSKTELDYWLAENDKPTVSSRSWRRSAATWSPAIMRWTTRSACCRRQATRSTTTPSNWVAAARMA